MKPTANAPHIAAATKCDHGAKHDGTPFGIEAALANYHETREDLF
jgi:hypothetical protein